MDPLHVLPVQVAEFCKALTDELRSIATSLEKIKCRDDTAPPAFDDIHEGIAAALDIAEVIAALARNALRAADTNRTDN